MKSIPACFFWIFMVIMIILAICVLICVPNSQPVATTFLDYSTTSSAAIVQLTNLTDRDIFCSVRIEHWVRDRWQRFEFDFGSYEFALSHAGVVLNPRGDWKIGVPIPTNSFDWRAEIRFRELPDDQDSPLFAKVRAVFTRLGIDRLPREAHIFLAPQSTIYTHVLHAGTERYLVAPDKQAGNTGRCQSLLFKLLNLVILAATGKTSLLPANCAWKEGADARITPEWSGRDSPRRRLGDVSNLPNPQRQQRSLNSKDRHMHEYDTKN